MIYTIRMMTLNNIIFYILSFFVSTIKKDLSIQKNIEAQIIEEEAQILEDIKYFYFTKEDK